MLYHRHQTCRLRCVLTTLLGLLLSGGSALAQQDGPANQDSAVLGDEQQPDWRSEWRGEEEVPEDALPVRVGAPYVNIYKGPGRGYPIFHVVEHGEYLWLEKRRTDWVKVSTRRGVSGWVRVRDLDQITDVAGQPLRLRQPDFDDYRNQRLHIGTTYGDFGGADSLGVIIGYRFTANLTGELRATQAVGTFSDSQTYQVAVTHQPFPSWRVSPYFMLGTGMNITSPNATIVATEDREDTAMLAGFGLKTYLSRRFVLRAEVANHYLLTSRENNQEITEWKLGFDVFM